MKKRILTIAALSLAMSGMAQDNYSFSQRTGSYVEITDGTLVSPPLWTDFREAVKLPFAFKYYDVAVDSVGIFDSGIDFLSNSSNFVSPIGDDLIARGSNQSPVSYKLTGSDSNHIFKIQWPNVAFFATEDAYPNDFVNYQIWIYERTNKIEIHYGSSSVTEASVVDLNLNPTLLDFSGSKGLQIGKNPASAEAYYNFASSEELDAHPAIQTVYVFTPGFPNGLKDAVNTSVNCYPNPVGERFVVSSSAPMEAIRVYNAAGVMVMNEKAEGMEHTVASSHLTAGVYIVQIETAAGVIQKKIVR